jgi:mannose-1-phosphate guanylyltransferase
LINAYHLHERLLAAVRDKRWPIPVQVQVEPVLLGTGGGISNALHFFRKEPFLVVNGDIVCDVSLPDLRRHYFECGSPAGLLLHDYPEFNNVAVASCGSILGFGKEAERLASEGPDRECLAFTGIHIIHPGIFEGFPADRPGDVLTVYRTMIDAGRPPQALRIPKFFWREVGSIGSYRSLHEELGRGEEDLIPPLKTGRAVWLDPQAEVSPDAHLRGYVSVGRGTRIMDHTEIEDSVLWDDVEVRPGSKLRKCIVADGVVVAGHHEDAVLIGSPG